MTDDRAHDGDPFAPGRLCYLQIPSVDPAGSARFYQELFGWQARGTSEFSAPGLIGQWVDRPAAPAGGPVGWITVVSIDAALEQVPGLGGRVIDRPSHDGPRRLATIADPAGNEIGIVEHHPRS